MCVWNDAEIREEKQKYLEYYLRRAIALCVRNRMDCKEEPAKNATHAEAWFRLLPTRMHTYTQIRVYNIYTQLARRFARLRARSNAKPRRSGNCERIKTSDSLVLNRWHDFGRGEPRVRTDAIFLSLSLSRVNERYAVDCITSEITEYKRRRATRRIINGFLIERK